MALPPRKSVAMLFLGGATIDERLRLGDTVNSPAQVKPWLRAMSEMDIIAETQGVFITSGVTAVSLPDWRAAAAAVDELYDEVDGFVIVHQLETLPAAANALSLMLNSIGKPVVLCGSSLSSTKSRTTKPVAGDFGAKASFINAVQVAVSDAAEIMVVYGSHIYRAGTLIGPMTDAKGEIIGKIDFGLRFFGPHAHRHQRTWKAAAGFDTNVAVAEYLPGVDLQHLLHLPRGTRAIFLSSPGESSSMSGAIATLRKSLPEQTPIVVYLEAKAAGFAGTISVHGPSRSAALLKVMWALGQTTDQKKLKKLLS